MVSASFKSLLALAALAASVVAAPAGNGKYSGRFVAPPAHNTTVVQRRGPDGLVNFGYFANWASNAPLNFKASSIPVKDLTHVLYAFVDSDKSTGALFLSDAATDTGGAESGTLGGQLGELFKLKQENRHLKTLFSIGGWTYSQDGHFDFLSNAAARTKFVEDAVKMVEDYGFDGVDIDYEAARADQTADFVALFKELREALDKYAKDKGDTEPYLITSAVFTKAEEWTAKATEYIDLYLLMAYDFSGSWVTSTAYQSNLLTDGNNGGLSVESGVKNFLAHTPAERIVMGQPLYGRAFADTEGYNKPYNGVGDNQGIRLYKDLPASGPTVHEDLTIGASYSYDPATKEFVAYDTPGVTKVKSKYIKDNKLGGAMWWDLSTDKTGADSLVSIAASELGSLDKSNNHLNFPNSKYDNVKAAGGDAQTPGGGGQETETPTEPTTPPTETPKPTPTQCAARRRRA